MDLRRRSCGGGVGPVNALSQMENIVCHYVSWSPLVYVMEVLFMELDDISWRILYF